MSVATPSIEAVALVAARNQRLYLNARVAYEPHDDDDDEDEAAAKKSRVRNEMLRLEYAAHCALDAIEERSVTRGPNGETAPAAVCYLGLVLALEDVAIYAMTTSTKLRILLLLRPGETRIRDLDCVTILRAIHTCYLSHIGNPFHALPDPRSHDGQPHMQPGQANAHLPIKSALFDKRIRGIGGW